MAVVATEIQRRLLSQRKREYTRYTCIFYDYRFRMPSKERKQKAVKKQLETAAKGSLSLKDWIQGNKGDQDRGMCRLIGYSSLLVLYHTEPVWIITDNLMLT